jgi:hypothetical protein
MGDDDLDVLHVGHYRGVIGGGSIPETREREFIGGTVFIVSGFKTYLETGAPMVAAGAATGAPG